jgi:DNA polymerase I
VTRIQDEWLWGWDPTPGIVSVWAEPDGRATVWRRGPTRELLREEVTFRPWLLLSSLSDLQHLGNRLRAEGPEATSGHVTYEELEGDGGLRYLVRAQDGRSLARAVLHGARQRMGRPVSHLRELGAQAVLALPPEEQYLVASGRTYFKDLAFDDLRRLQVDLETSGLDPGNSRIFLVALRCPEGNAETMEVTRDDDDNAEAELLIRLCERIRVLDPDVIENHNLHGFDVPFLVQRARRLGVSLWLGRTNEPGLLQRPAALGRQAPLALHHAGPRADRFAGRRAPSRLLCS